MSIGSISGGSSDRFSAHSAKMAEKLIKKLDTDQNSSISGAELAAFISGSGSTTLSAETIMSKADADGSGELSSTELQSAFEKIGKTLAGMDGRQKQSGTPPSKSDMVNRMIADLDTDGNGTISKTEMSAMKMPENGNGPSAADTFTNTDTDSNGELSATELQSFMENQKPMGPPPPLRDEEDSESNAAWGSSTVSGTAAGKSKYDSAVELLKALQASDDSESATEEAAGAAGKTDTANMFAKLLKQIQNGAGYSSAGSMSSSLTSSLFSISA